GGAIPETGDYRVLMEPGDVFIGTVNEDFAIESMQGDVFLLGSHPWQIAQVRNGVMRVRDATGRHPTIPFWLGEAPGRTDELSEEVSRLRSDVAEQLDAGGRAAAVAHVRQQSGVEDVPGFLRSHNVQDAVSQAVLRSPMFTARWRWNLNRALAVLRRKGGRLNPFNIQRMEADDLMAAVFPSLAACQDNVPPGPIEIPDHVLVRETMGDCLHEAMDIEGLKALVRRFEQNTVRVHFIDTVEPSVLSHEILGGAPFTYLDEDTEIGERRSRAVPLLRGLPVEPRELGQLDAGAIERVRAEA